MRADTNVLTTTRSSRSSLSRIVGLESIPGVRSINVAGHTTAFEADASAVGTAFDAVHAAGVRSLFGQPPTLEQLFLRHYEAELNGVEPGVAR